MTTAYTKNFALALPDFRSGPWHDLVNGNSTKIDQIIYGALTGVDTPAWDNDVEYQIGQQVIDTDSASTWVALVEHTSPPTGTFEEYRTANPTHWTQLLAGFAPRGEWANATEYRPYDLAYESATGIFAQCKTRHISNVGGTIEDDATYWYWIVNFSSSDLGEALTVSYVPTAPITGTNVQVALDDVAGFIIALNNVNITQGNQIDTLQDADAVHDSRLTAVESTNLSQTTLIENLQTALTALTNTVTTLSDAVVRLAANQTIGPGGFSAPAKAWGNKTGTYNLDPKVDGNYQTFNNVGAVSIVAPTVDCGIDILMTNGAGAVIPGMSGFTVNPTNAGDPYTATNGHRFLISVRRLGGISTYAVKALQ